jgi:ribose transport system substrate-binding protein
MKKAAWILALLFGLVFAGATLMNAILIGKARAVLPGELGKAGPKSEAARYHLIVVLPDTDDSFFTGLLEGVSAASEGAGAAVQVFRYPIRSPLEAERFFEIAIRAKADGLIMYSPRDDSGPASSSARAAEAARSGVVFVPVGTDAPPGQEGPFIGSGSMLQGLEGGRLIGERLGSRARVGVILPASEKGRGKDEPLYRGVAEALRAFPGASIAAAAEALPSILSGEAVAESMLRLHPGINAILCSSARDTVGAAQVLIDLNEVGEVLIIGADETPDIRRYIDKGVVAASIVRDSRKMGEEAVRAFAAIKAGGSRPSPAETEFFVVKMKEAAR